MSTTLKDVAKEAGITVTTVSRVLNNRGPISEKTRKKVYGAIKKLNYSPNEAARSLAKKYSNIIGVIVPSVNNPFFAECAEYLEKFAYEKKYKIMLCNSYHQKSKEIEYIEMLKANKVAGIFISSRTPGIGKYLSSNLPIVSFERIIDDSISSVSCDNYNGGVLATTRLIDDGCKYLINIGGISGLSMLADERTRAFEDICSQRGIAHKVYETHEKQFQTMDYTEFLKKIISENPLVDGIFASSDIIAAQMIKVCSSLGYKIPTDLKIIGYDDVQIASLLAPGITTIHQPLDQMCRAAINTIIDSCEGSTTPTRITCSVKLIIRETA